MPTMDSEEGKHSKSLKKASEIKVALIFDYKFCIMTATLTV